MDILEFLEKYWFFVLFGLVVLFAAYLGLLNSVEAKESKFPGGLFFYKDRQVASKHLGPIFREINEDIQEYQKTLPKKVVYPKGGIFYDDPGSLADENKMRVSVGFLVEAKNSTVEEHFKKLEYKVTDLPQAVSIYTSHTSRLNIGF